MRQYRGLTFGYAMVLSLIIGILTGAYLQAVNVIIAFFWRTLPNWLGIVPAWRPWLICLPLGLVIGLCQKCLGQYPLTIGQVVGEVRIKGHFSWHRWWRILLCGLLILGAGADVGPEASASGLLAGMIYWLGCRYKSALARADELRDASWWRQLATIIGQRTVSTNTLPLISSYFASESAKKRAYAIWIACGCLGLVLFFRAFPQEGVIGFHLPPIAWHWQGALVVIPALVGGWAFGWLFAKFGELGEKVAGRPSWPVLKALLGGLLLMAGSTWSTDILFSGEFTIQPFAKHAYYLAPLFLIALGLMKALISNFGFALGWRGGTIFPAIFSSLAMGAALAQFLGVMPQLTVTIFLAAAITTIIRRPLLTVILLALLCPLQFLLFIIAAAYLVNGALRRLTFLQP
ncbi:voltage-gated chloride channel family protein [Limosilactobacillus difficilis]|uniref:chloride channel protein n=1 Tax=Limosilactobacillus difficilis TaxID=2991838 RepID=UPI0024BB0B39|nr:chloride channel protein [Limosilactobacillus difficilis]